MKILALLLIFLSVIVTAGYGQSMVITDSTTTPSICFNDGTISLSFSGGSGAYSYSIISGPSYPNISYPITLPTLASVFLTIPRGQYTIRLVDAIGDTAYATATVGGTYTFPVISPPLPDTVYGTCLSVNTVGGRPQYRYSISSLGTNTGFGPYQNSNTFCHLCDGSYWIRVMDSCSNIFTTNRITIRIPALQINISYQTVGNMDSITVHITSQGALPYSYNLQSGALSITNNTGVFSLPVRCPIDTIIVTDSCGHAYLSVLDMHPLSAKVTSICHSGSAIIQIDSAAIAPYTITGSNGSLITHQNLISFNSLPIDSQYHFTISDSCGHTLNPVVTCIDTPFFYNVCPFDSSVHMLYNPVHFCYPVVVTCVSCSPVQIDTIMSTPARLFTGIQIGVPYTIRIQDQCGFNFLTADTPRYARLSVTDSIFTCRDFAMISTPRVFLPPIHYSLFNSQGTLIDSMTSNPAIFYHIPAGTYQVAATQPLCLASTITLTLPLLQGACMVPMYDSACNPLYAIYQNVLNYTETYSLVNTITSATYIQQIPTPYPNTALFEKVPAGNYNLVSDSGCSVPIVLPPLPAHTVTAISSHQCTGQALIQANCTPPIRSCNGSQSAYYVLLKDNQYISSNLTGHFTVSDTGYYVVRLFLSNTTVWVFSTIYDTICPLDTTLIYVTNNAIPNIISTQAEVCGHTQANIPYTIFGGSAPYTVQILGYPTRTVNSTIDTFPNIYPGVYTMIVSDFCGISRSFSISVIDTCSRVCTIHSQSSISDTAACIHSVISLQNQSSGATHYRWDINGNLFAYATDTSFTSSTPGRYTITLYAYIGVCVDSSKHILQIEDSLYHTGLRDTSLCPPFSFKINTHTGHTLWSNGIADSLITLTTSGTYIAKLSNVCDSVFDTVVVHSYPSIRGFELNSSKDFLCEGTADSSILTARIDSGQQTIIFRWNIGTTDSNTYSSNIVIYQADSIQVIADNGYCPLIKNIHIAVTSCDSECIAGIAIPNIFSPNGDGRNDTFYILHICDFDPFVMHIYDRWGQLVFESTDITKGWDGKYHGNPEPEEVYWLWLSLTLPDKRTVYRSGTVTLVR